MSNLKIKKRTVDDIMVVTPMGMIDVRQMVQLRTFFSNLEEKSLFHVAMDMGGVTFIDSYGVSVLTNFSNKLKLQEGGLVFYNCKKETKDFLNVAGIDQIIPILETFDEVKEHFSE